MIINDREAEWVGFLRPGNWPDDSKRKLLLMPVPVYNDVSTFRGKSSRTRFIDVREILANNDMHSHDGFLE